MTKPDISGIARAAAKGQPYWPVSNRTADISANDEKVSGAPLDFTGRVAIVTGAARGLGRAVAARLYERGASVAVNVRDATRATALAASLGDRALSVPGDIAADGVPDDIVRRTVDRFGRIDVLVNNAAYARS